VCARCKEEDELIEQAIKASMIENVFICRNGCHMPLAGGSKLCQQCMEQEELERAIQASSEVDTTCHTKCVDVKGFSVANSRSGLEDDVDCRESSQAVAMIPTESLAVENADETYGEDVAELSQTTHVLKAKLNDDTRRLQVVWCSNAVAEEMLQVISEGVRHVFDLKSSAALVLTYKDDCDGDMLTLAETTVEDFLASQSGPLRIFVKVQEDTSAFPLSVSHIEVDTTQETTPKDSCQMGDAVEEPEQAMELSSEGNATKQEAMAEDPHETGCTARESGHAVDSPSEGNETKDDHEHFIGHDLSNWDDFEHVADPLEDWYDNPAVVVVAGNDHENNVGDGQEDRAELS